MKTTESTDTPRMSKKPSWPKILTRTWESGKAFKIDAQSGKKREFHSFKTEAEAITKAWEIFRDREKQGKAAFVLSGADRVIADRCMKKLSPYGATLEQATDYYVAHVAKFRQAPTIREITDRIIEQAKANGRSATTVLDLRHRLKVFTDKFGDQKPAEITLEDLEQWVNGIALSPRSRCHYLTKASQLYSYAIKHGWAADNLIAKLSRPDIRQGIPHHLTVEQAAKLLQHAADNNLVAFVALGLFAGIRPDEIRRLTWDMVKLDNKVIILDQTATKTGQHRVVELNATALAWLRTCSKKTGRIVDMPTITFKRTWKKLRADAGFKKWSNDDMRHTAATYLCALTGDYAKVAADLGHDVRVLHRHYRGLTTKAEAERFLKLTPAKVTKGKIVAMPAPTDQAAEQAPAIEQAVSTANA